ncbi:MAG: hypothetical protein IK099_02675 [Clostridia bacterium]|nr:hypothetical protein [Clostridia bacterium]
MPKEKEEAAPQKTTAGKRPAGKPVSDMKSAAEKERDWADRTEEASAAPYEETYRDGSMKNECW